MFQKHHTNYVIIIQAQRFYRVSDYITQRNYYVALEDLQILSGRIR